jgi:ABC-type oligopeptide transport system ATPase subunit
MTVPLLELVGVGKIYPLKQSLLPRLLGHRDDHAAMEDVSLVVPRGGVLGLVGESGSGKSTTARIILQMEQPTTGTTRFDARC